MNDTLNRGDCKLSAKGMVPRIGQGPTFKGVPRSHNHDNQETVEQSLETLEIAETKVTGIALL